MIQQKQEKKVKGKRKKDREEVLERLKYRFPLWFDNKSENEIKRMIIAFRLSGEEEDNFPHFCTRYEAQCEKDNN